MWKSRSGRKTCLLTLASVELPNHDDVAGTKWGMGNIGTKSGCARTSLEKEDVMS